MTRVKICGITNLEDARRASDYGAWALGFNFYKRSPRYISASNARDIIRRLPPFITPVGVFVNENEDTIKRIADFCNLSVLQFHGDETPSFCRRFKGYKLIKVFRVTDKIDLLRLKSFDVASVFLFDTFHREYYGGRGKAFNWNCLRDIENIKKPVIISGGLNPQNVIKVINKLEPYAVDVCSGVEKYPGRKDDHLLRSFIEKVLH